MGSRARTSDARAQGARILGRSVAHDQAFDGVGLHYRRQRVDHASSQMPTHFGRQFFVKRLRHFFRGKFTYVKTLKNTVAMPQQEAWKRGGNSLVVVWSKVLWLQNQRRTCDACGYQSSGNALNFGLVRLVRFNQIELRILRPTQIGQRFGRNKAIIVFEFNDYRKGDAVAGCAWLC